MKVKVKHILTIIGVFLGGMAVASSASAVVTFEGHSDVQFTFGPTLSLSLSSTLSDCPAPYYDPTFCIENLVPNTSSLSNVVTATVSTNNSVGYTLSATVGGTALDGTTTYTGTDLVHSTVAGAKFVMIDDTVSTSLTAGKWGFTLNGSAATPTYMTLDDTNSRVINATSDAAGTPASASYGGTDTTTMQIGAYADNTQIPGAYGNVINFTAVGNVQMRTVTVAANNADVASVEINSVDGTAITPVMNGSWGDGQVLGISATCAAGKPFLGWAKSYDFGQLANMDSATTTFMVGGGDITLTAYCGGVPPMQNMSAASCTATPTLVRDTRDNQTYTVARLADGNCWMTNNLRFGYNANNYAPSYTTTLTLSPTDSDVTQTRTITTHDLKEHGASGGDCYAEWNSSTSTYEGPGMSNPCMRSRSTEATTPADGVWYNYAAATAGTITGNSNTTDATESICPKGWKLPTYTQIDDLVTAIGSSPAAFAPVYGGDYWQGELYGETEGGGWWSATADDDDDRYELDYYEGELDWSLNDRNDGNYVRCVLGS